MTQMKLTSPRERKPVPNPSLQSLTPRAWFVYLEGAKTEANLQIQDGRPLPYHIMTQGEGLALQTRLKVGQDLAGPRVDLGLALAIALVILLIREFKKVVLKQGLQGFMKNLSNAPCKCCQMFFYSQKLFFAISA